MDDWYENNPTAAPPNCHSCESRNPVSFSVKSREQTKDAGCPITNVENDRLERGVIFIPRGADGTPA